MKIGYARVSKLEQTLDMQLDALKKDGCERIITDKLTGSVIERPGLDKVKELAREGDTVVVFRLDRLGRSTKHLIETVTEFQNNGISFRSLGEDIDTGSATGKLIFHIFCALAEFERSLISERTKKSLLAARARGIQGGRKKKLNQEQVQILKKLYDERETPVKTLCSTFKITIPTLYRYLKSATKCD